MSVEQQIESLSADVEELQSLVTSAKRDTVKKALQGVITQLNQQQDVLKKQLAKPATEQSNKYENLKSVTTFYWDQTKDFVKIYLEFGDEVVDSADIKLDITSKRSFIIAYGSRKFVQTKLHADIDKEKSHFKTTKSKIIVYLKKAAERNWTSLKENADSYKKMVEEEKDEMSDDPQAGLMKMMKKMYDEGDDDMKRTIAKSWYESQQKQGQGGSGGADPMAAFNDL